MNKKGYICPDTQFVEMNAASALLTTSPGSLNIDGSQEISSEEDVFSREENGGSWGTGW